MSEVFVLQFYDVREIQDSFIYVEEPEILGVFRSYEEAQAFARDQQDEWLDAIQTTADLTNTLYAFATENPDVFDAFVQTFNLGEDGSVDADIGWIVDILNADGFSLRENQLDLLVDGLNVFRVTAAPWTPRA